MENDAPALEGARSLGARFATERERQGLSRVDVAQRLRMSVSQVEALESGDHSRLPTGTFLRGFVRNYARALGLEPEPLVNALAGMAPHEAPPKLVVASQNIRFDPIGDRLSHPYVKAAGVATALVVLGFAVMYWWLFIRPTPPAALARKPSVESVAVPAAGLQLAAPPAAFVEPPKEQPLRTDLAKAEPAPAVPTAPAKVEAPRAEPAKTEAPQAPPAKADVKPVPSAKPPAADAALSKAATQAQPAGARSGEMMTAIEAAPVIAAGGSVIRFRFKGNSWVEIKDSRGKVLLSRMNPGGSEAEVIGKAPFSVVVGNAPEVQMFYNQREFNLEPHTRVAVARFTVE
jgi:cytoskeleton protein RodZ